MSIRDELMGHQRPRLYCCPEAVGSAGPAAVALAEMAGLKLDPWQAWVVEQILGEKEEMYWNEVLQRYVPKSSAYESALVVARQNGKGSIMEALELAWLFLLGAKTICHSAHEFATSKEHFQRVESLVSGTPELKAELARGGIKWSHGDESINLRTGQRLIFKTRTKGAARGFSIDKLVMDEAMILKKEQVGAMLPATAARPDVQIVYAGSAGDEDSEHFGRARDRGINKTDPRLFFAEWSIDPHDDMCPKGCTEHDDNGDPESWAKANPGLGIRLQVENIQSEFYGMDAEVFERERLSVGTWPVAADAWRIIPKDAWEARKFAESYLLDFVIAVDTTPEVTYTCITAAGRNDEGFMHVEITGREEYDHKPGVAWVVPRVKEIWKNNRPKAVVIDKRAQAGMFIDELEAAGIKVISPTMQEFAQSCGEFYVGVVPRKGNQPNIVHLDQKPLNNAVAGADKRDLADAWAWSRRSAAVDISPLVGATLAAWGHKKMVNEKPVSPPWVRRR